MTRILALVAAVFATISLTVLMTRLAPAWHPCCLGQAGIVERSLENVPLWVAEQQKFFDPARLQLRLRSFRTTGQILDAVAEREIDFGYAVDLKQTFLSILKARTHTLIGSVANAPPQFLLARPPAKSISDVVGFRIGVVREDLAARSLLAVSLGSAGIDASRVKLVESPTVPELLEAALTKRSVEAVLVPSLEALFFQQRGFNIVGRMRDHTKDFAAYGIVVRADWIAAHPTDSRAIEFLAGLMKAHKWLLDARSKAEVLGIVKEKLPDVGESAGRVYDEFIASGSYFSSSPAVSDPAVRELLKALAPFAAVGQLPGEAINREIYRRAEKP